MRYVAYHGLFLLLFTQCATSNASRHFKSPLAMGRDAFKTKHASSVSISEVIDTGVNSNLLFTYSRNLPGLQQHDIRQTPFFGPGSSCTVPIHHRCRSCYHTDHTVSGFSPVRGLALQHSLHAAILFLFQADLPFQVPLSREAIHAAA